MDDYSVINNKGEVVELTPIGTCGADNPCKYWGEFITYEGFGICNNPNVMGDCQTSDGESPSMYENFGCNKWKAKEQDGQT